MQRTRSKNQNSFILSLSFSLFSSINIANNIKFDTNAFGNVRRVYAMCILSWSKLAIAMISFHIQMFKSKFPLALLHSCSSSSLCLYDMHFLCHLQLWQSHQCALHIDCILFIKTEMANLEMDMQLTATRRKNDESKTWN